MNYLTITQLMLRVLPVWVLGLLRNSRLWLQQILIRGQTRNADKALSGLMLQRGGRGAEQVTVSLCLLSKEGDLCLICGEG